MAHFHSEGLNVHYDTFGEDATGTPIILVHGTGCRAEVLARVAKVLAADLAVAAIDLPATAARTAMDFAAPPTMPISSPPSRTTSAGHGSCSSAIRSAAPSRSSSRRTIRIDLPVSVLWIRARGYESIRRSAATRAALTGIPGPEIDPRWSFGAATTDETIELVNRDRGDVAPDVVYRDWVADDTFDFLARLKHIHVRSIAIGGSEDRLTPVRNHIAFREFMPDCELAIIENSGHWPFYEQPEAFDDALEGFLATIDE